MDDADWSPATLAEARVAIDDVDAAMLDLLHRRARIVGHVGRIKREAEASPSANAFRPARELQMLRHLAARTHDPLAFSTVYAIWREIVSGFTAAQMPLVIAATPRAAPLARDTFGAHADIDVPGGAATVLATMDENVGTIGLIALGEINWDELAAQPARIVARAPFLRAPGTAPIDAWCLSHTPLGPSGDDITIVAAPLRHGGTAVELARTDTRAILACEGFHADDSSALAARLGTDDFEILGAYPVPLMTGQDR